ncbi:winged helix-turn-helix domain-containing protein [Streptomyces sp. NBC_01500]|nr:winged helix-turn-helix domain-containing protein [Streptomyces sp. NBC_01500]MCX4553670.1 winged helix-turn-helix domain-containing protein [Streptomyces sp. NBC_01500]
MWTAARAATLIGRKFHVSYSVSGATWLMHRLGFSPQVPARRVSERDEQAVTVRKEATWAEVKEPGQPAEATSASRTRRASLTGRPKDAPGFGAVTPPLPCLDGPLVPLQRPPHRHLPAQTVAAPPGSCIPRETGGRSPT